jgi:hypothetical protein
MLGKKKEEKCPMAGCSRKWTRESSSEDVEFKHEMERFFRNAALTQSEPSQGANTVEIDDDDDDEEEGTLVN